MLQEIEEETNMKRNILLLISLVMLIVGKNSLAINKVSAQNAGINVSGKLIYVHHITGVKTEFVTRNSTTSQVFTLPSGKC